MLEPKPSEAQPPDEFGPPLTYAQKSFILRRRAGSEGTWGSRRQQINDYARFRDKPIHNPNCAGGGHRTGTGSGPTYYPGTQLPESPRKWTWWDYRKAAILRKRKEAKA